MKPEDLPDAAQLFDPAAATQDGWRVPVTGQLVSYLYFGPSDFSFEIWLGGDNDLTVKIERAFSLRQGSLTQQFDPRTTRKSQLAPVLAVSDLTVAGLTVRRSGLLEIEFEDDWGLIVEPAADGRSWVMGWPLEGPSIVACAAGGIIRVNDPDEPWAYPTVGHQIPDPGHAPIEQRGEDSTALPIRGLAREAAATSLSIELALPIPDGGRFDIHFGGEVRIAGRPGGDWAGEARGAAVLDLVGESVVRAHMDATERLHLEFGDGRVLVASRGTWEASWPAAVGSSDDVWVPREGPNIP